MATITAQMVKELRQATGAGILECKKAGITTVALTGAGGGELAPLADIALIVPSNSTARVQEAHITIGHIICELVEEGLF